MKKILFFSLIFISSFCKSQDIGICGLANTVTGTPHDMIIKEDSDCTDVNGTKAMYVKDFISHYGIATTSGSWKTTGNAGTSGTNFIGTTDAHALIIKTNNVQRMLIGGSGDMAIGLTSPFVPPANTRFYIKGPTSDSTYTALRVDDNSGNPLFSVRDDSYVGVNGQLQISDGTQGANKVLTSHINGVGRSEERRVG